MKFRKIILLIIFFAISVSFSSCILMVINASTVKSKAIKSLTKGSGSIPPEFGSKDVVILVKKSGKKSYDKYLINNFEAYLGKYEIIDNQYVLNKKYYNKEVYRYLFDFEFERKEGYEDTYRVRRFFIHDRVINKKYEANIVSTYWSKIIKAYVSNLNDYLD